MKRRDVWIFPGKSDGAVLPVKMPKELVTVVTVVSLAAFKKDQ